MKFGFQIANYHDIKQLNNLLNQKTNVDFTQAMAAEFA